MKSYLLMAIKYISPLDVLDKESYRTGVFLYRENDSNKCLHAVNGLCICRLLLCAVRRCLCLFVFVSFLFVCFLLSPAFFVRLVKNNLLRVKTIDTFIAI